MKLLIAIALTTFITGCADIGKQQFAGKQCKNVGNMFQDVWMDPDTDRVCSN